MSTSHPGAAGVGDDAASAAGRDETSMALDAAHRYYEQDESKTDIGKALGISRFQVARLLTEARRSGLVRIEIGSPGREDDALAAAVARAFGLDDVVVVEASPTSQRATFTHLGRALARQLERVVLEGSTVGLTWSRTIPPMAGALRHLPPCTIVQLAGAVQPPADLPGSVEVARSVAEKADGQAHTFYAPLLVPDAATAEGLRRQPNVAGVAALWSTLDVAVISVGAWQQGSSAVFDLVEPAQREALYAEGARGEVSGRVLDATGRPLTAVDDRVVGATLDQLRAAPLRLVSSCGEHRREATLGVIAAGLVTTLVIDDALARALLA